MGISEQERIQRCRDFCPHIKDNMWWASVARTVAERARSAEALQLVRKAFTESCSALVRNCTEGPVQFGERYEFECPSSGSVQSVVILDGYTDKIADIIDRNAPSS